MDTYIECRCNLCLTRNRISLDAWVYNQAVCVECESTSLYIEDENFDPELFADHDEYAMVI